MLIRGRETPSPAESAASLVGLLAAILIHAFMVGAVYTVGGQKLIDFVTAPAASDSLEVTLKKTDRKEPEIFIEANPDANTLKPEDSRFYASQDQRAAQETPDAEALPSPMPKVEGEAEQSQKIVEGSLDALRLPPQPLGDPAPQGTASRETSSYAGLWGLTTRITQKSAENQSRLSTAVDWVQEATESRPAVALPAASSLSPADSGKSTSPQEESASDGKAERTAGVPHEQTDPADAIGLKVLPDPKESPEKPAPEAILKAAEVTPPVSGEGEKPSLVTDTPEPTLEALPEVPSAPPSPSETPQETPLEPQPQPTPEKSTPVEPVPPSMAATQGVAVSGRRERPRVATRTPPGPLRNNTVSTNEAGSVAVDSEFSEFGGYQQRLLESIALQWNELAMQSKLTGQEIGTVVRVSFALDPSGNITRLNILATSSSRTGTYLVKQSIESRAPFGEWTEAMRQLLGEDAEITITFYYR